jgi:threonine/homoserine/homoserine lactone efflux protein
VDGLLGFGLAGTALAGSPGPGVLSLAAIGAAFGAKRGFAYAIGLVAGMVAVMAFVATGVMGMLLAVPGVSRALAALAAGYFVYLAARIALAPPLSTAAAPRRQPTFAGGVLLSLVNPKGYAAAAALFSGFVLVRGQPVADVATKMVVFVAIMSAANLAWLFAGAALMRACRAPRIHRTVNVAFALLLMASLVLTLAF